MKKIFLITLIAISVNGFSQQLTDSIIKCLTEKSEFFGVDYLETMKLVENELISLEILDSNDQISYLNAFKSLNEDNLSFALEDLKKDIFNNEERNIVFLHTYLKHCFCFTFESKIKDNLNDTANYVEIEFIKFNDFSSENTQMYLMNKLETKGYDNEENLMDLIVLTDFNNELLRLNVTYVFLFNLLIKYGNEIIIEDK